MQAIPQFLAIWSRAVRETMQINFKRRFVLRFTHAMTAHYYASELDVTRAPLGLRSSRACTKQLSNASCINAAIRPYS